MERANLVLETVLYAGAAGVSQVGLLLSVTFWTWLWGPAGLLVATPLTVVLVVMGKHVRGLEAIATLMADTTALPAAQGCYQRLLARDTAEAGELVERHVRNEPPRSVYDELLLPALAFVEADRLENRVTTDEEGHVLAALQELVEDAAEQVKKVEAEAQTPRLSPDRRRVLVSESASVLAAWDLERRAPAQLTPPSPGTRFGVWSRDGSQVMYRRFDIPTLARSDGSEPPTPIPYATVNDYPSGPGPGADTLLVTRIQPGSLGDVFVLSTIGAFEPKSLVVTNAYEGGPHLSPDQRWIVYAATGGGRTAVFVRRYASLARQWPVSGGTGNRARWSADGREIYYRDGTSIMAVPFDGSGDEPVMGKATALFRDDYEYGPGLTIANHDATPDGRFLMLRRESQGGQSRVGLNWTEQLKQLIARGGVR